MDKAIFEALGLADAATTDAIVAKVNELKAAPDAAVKAVASKAGLTDADTPDKIVAAVGKLRDDAKADPNPSKWVAATVHADAVKRIETLEATALKAACDVFIAGGKSAGKIVTASEPAWRRLYAGDPIQSEKDLESAPKLVATGAAVSTSGTVAKPARDECIAKARTEYDASTETVRNLATRGSWINTRLADAGHKTLTKDEAAAV